MRLAFFMLLPALCDPLLMIQSFDDSILKYFSGAEDLRVEDTKQYLLVDIITA